MYFGPHFGPPSPTMPHSGGIVGERPDLVFQADQTLTTWQGALPGQHSYAWTHLSYALSNPRAMVIKSFHAIVPRCCSVNTAVA